MVELTVVFLPVHIKAKKFAAEDMKKMKYPVWVFMLFTAGFVFCQADILMPDASKSSPSHIIADKGSSVWLHWNYTYVGDRGQGYSTYKEQLIGFNSPFDSYKVLAKRIGQNGALRLESPIPAPFNGRVEVISSNSTLVIHNLKYVDEFFQFSSTVTTDKKTGAGLHSNTVHLLPNVTITVYGPPSFMKEPPRILEVNENSNLLHEVYMAGNPEPILYAKWSHLHPEWSRISPSVQLLRFLYVSKYKLSNIDGSYCGRTLEIKVKNRIGEMRTSSTVTVLLELDRPLVLKARKFAASKCVEVKWKKLNSGVCNVSYNVVLKSASGEVLYNTTIENIGKRKICNLLAYANITYAQLTVRFKGISKVATAKVSEARIVTLSGVVPVTEPSFERMTSRSAASIVHCEPTTAVAYVMASSMATLLILIIITIIVLRMSRARKMDYGFSHQSHQLSDDKEINEVEVHDNVEPDDFMVCSSSEESSADDKEESDESELSTIRSEVRFISDKGAAMELYVTGIKLKVPSGTFATDTMLKLSTLDPSTTPEFQTAIGEAAIGNVIKIGPAKLKFNVPIILSIPYSIVDIPKHSSICIKYFDEDNKKWLQCPVIPGDSEERRCNGYVDRPGLYVLCLLLNTDTHVISQSSAEIWPFDMQPGVEVKFDKNTFQDDQTTVDFKINTFTERMCEDFESVGMKPIAVVHINVRNNCQPQKAVTISFPMPVDSFYITDLLILQSDNGDEFTDVTKQVVVGWLQHRVLVRVQHFTLFAFAIKLLQVVNINNIRRLFRNMYEVHVCVYESKETGWSLRICCCEASLREEMEHDMRISMFSFVTCFTTTMHHGAMLEIDFNGLYAIDKDERVLVFNENAISSTKPVEMQLTVPSECTPEISFLVNGSGTPIVLPLTAGEASECSSSQVLPCIEGDGLEQNRGFQGSVEDLQEVEEGLIIASEELTISDMKDDYNVVNDVDEILNCSTYGNIKDLSLRFDLSYKERCLVINSAVPSRHFVEDFFRTRKNLTLLDLKKDLEVYCEPPNKLIFKKIVKDIKNRSVSFSLATTLDELASDSESMLYIMDNIADNLVPEEGTLLPTWKNIGCCHGYKVKQLCTFTENIAKTKGEKTNRLLSSISRDEQPLPVSTFIKKLRDIKRNDAAIVIEKWRKMKSDAEACDDGADVLVEEQTLSKLQDSHNLRTELGRMLKDDDIRKLWSKYQLSDDQLNYIMNDVPPCHAFLESLSISQPELTLTLLRDTIECNCEHPNKAIFKKIDDDIKAELISYSLDTELGSLIVNPEHWLHFLTSLADNLLHRTPAQLQPSWQNVASTHGYKRKQIKALEDENKVKESRAERFLSVLYAEMPSLPLSDFTEKLEEISRVDASNLVKGWKFVQSED